MLHRDSSREITLHKGNYYADLLAPWLRVRQMALDLLAEMKARRLVPNLIVYNATVGACCRAGQLPEALEVLRSMHALRVRPR